MALAAVASYDGGKIEETTVLVAEVQVVLGAVVVVAQEDAAVAVVRVVWLKCVHGLSFLARSQKRMR